MPFSRMTDRLDQQAKIGLLTIYALLFMERTDQKGSPRTQLVLFTDGRGWIDHGRATFAILAWNTVDDGINQLQRALGIE